MKMRWLILVVCLGSSPLPAQDADKKGTTPSPDKKWEYRYTADISAEIAKAGKKDSVLDLSNEVPRPQDAKIVWGPDSKRFAFTYSPPHAPHTSYETTAFYQLQRDNWEPTITPLVEHDSERAQLRQLAPRNVPKNPVERSMWESSPTRDILRLREWSDPNTAIVYASAVWNRRGTREVSAAFLFTVQFDGDGNWKIIKSQELSKAEIEAQPEG
jgi:hypothetical protein